MGGKRMGKVRLLLEAATKKLGNLQALFLYHLNGENAIMNPVYERKVAFTDRHEVFGCIPHGRGAYIHAI